MSARYEVTNLSAMITTYSRIYGITFLRLNCLSSEVIDTSHKDSRGNRPVDSPFESKVHQTFVCTCLPLCKRWQYFAISRHLDCVNFTQSTSQSALNSNNTVGSQPIKGTCDLFTTIARTTVNAVMVDGTCKLTSFVYTQYLTRVTTVTVTKGQVTRPETAAFTLPKPLPEQISAPQLIKHTM